MLNGVEPECGCNFVTERFAVLTVVTVKTILSFGM